MEFALIAPLLFLVLFGIVEFGVVFSDSLSLRQGVREGARQGVVARFDSCGVAGDSKVACTTRSRIGLGDGVAVKVVVPAGYVVGDPLLVCAQREIESFTGLFAPVLNDRHLRSKVKMRIEKVGTPAISSSEDAGSWSWCS